MKQSKNRVRKYNSWSKLPGKIIYKISKNLKTRDDILRFRRVCLKWRKRSVTPSQNLLSIDIPLPITMNSSSFSELPFHTSEDPLVLQVSNIYLITPSLNEGNDQSSTTSVCLRPWMIMAEESDSGAVEVRHPLTAKRVTDFLPRLDLTRFHVSVLAQGFNFKSSNCVYKVLLCSSSATSVEVMVLYYKGVLGKLSLEVLESGAAENVGISRDANEEESEVSWSWKRLKRQRGAAIWFAYLDDIVKFKNMHCGVDRKGKLYAVNPESMIVADVHVLVSKPIYRESMPNRRRKRLVVDSASGELHLVVREKAQKTHTVRFKVYKLNEPWKRWDLVQNIGSETVLFVGIDHCFFAMAKHFPGCQGNSVIFATNCFTQYTGRDAPDQSLFQDEETDIGVYRLGEGDNFSLLHSAYPEFAQTIWPPPTYFWIKRECDEEMEEGPACQQSDEVANSSPVSLPHNQVENLLSDSSSGGIISDKNDDDDDDDKDVVILSDSSDNDDDDDDQDVVILSDSSDNDDDDDDDDEKMELDCSGRDDVNDDMESDCSDTPDSEASDKSKSKDNKEAQTSSCSEQQHASDADFPDHSKVTASEPVTKEKEMSTHSVVVRTQERDDKTREEAKESTMSKHSVTVSTRKRDDQLLEEALEKDMSKYSVVVRTQKRDDQTREEAKEKDMRKHSVSVSTRSRDDKTREKANEKPMSKQSTTRGTRKMDDQTPEEGPNNTEDKPFDASTTPPLAPSGLPAYQNYPTVKFQGVDIRSELLPTLQTIWAKHGDLIGEHTVRRKMLAGALEDLAELYSNLKNTTARTLDDKQTDYMRSVLSDIQRAGLKVDWLESVISNAAAVQKSVEFIKSKVELEEKMAKIELEKKQLEDDIACLSARIPFPEDQIIDLDDCLGLGL